MSRSLSVPRYESTIDTKGSLKANDAEFKHNVRNGLMIVSLHRNLASIHDAHHHHIFSNHLKHIKTVAKRVWKEHTLHEQGDLVAMHHTHHQVSHTVNHLLVLVDVGKTKITRTKGTLARRLILISI